MVPSLIEECFVKVSFWSVVVVGIAAAVEFVNALVLSGFACLFFLILGQSWREH